MVKLSKHTYRMLLGGVAIMGLLVRIPGLEQTPPGLWLDEAGHGLDAAAILNGLHAPIFFPGNCGREPLYTYLVAGSIALLGPTTAAVRLPAAIIGWLTILALAPLLHRAFNDQWLTLAASGLLAFSRWHVHFSRIAFRGILVPLFAIMTWWSLLKALHTRRRRDFLVAGIILGLSMYSYTPVRMLLPMAMVIILLHAWLERKPLRVIVSGSGIMILMFTITALPLIIYMRTHPGAVTARLRMTSIMALDGGLLSNLRVSAITYLGMFHVHGDWLLRHNIPGAPMLDPLTGILFVVGILMALHRCRRPAYLTSVLFTVAFLVPGILSSYGPHALRTLALPPFISILAGLPLAAAARRWRRIGSALTCMVVVISGAWNMYLYCIPWHGMVVSVPLEKDCVDGLDIGEVAAVNWIRQHSAAHPKESYYLSPQLYFHATLQYLLYRRVDVEPAIVDGIPSDGPIAHVVLNLTPRNAWWMRDSDDKKYAYWWQLHYGMRLGQIHSVKIRGYPPGTNFTRVSDELLLNRLKERFPLGSLETGQGFAVFHCASASQPTAPRSNRPVQVNSQPVNR